MKSQDGDNADVKANYESIMRNIDGISRRQASGQDDSRVTDFEPVNITHRFVLRSQGTLPARKLWRAQSLFIYENARLNGILQRVLHDADNMAEILIYIALINFCEELVF